MTLAHLSALSNDHLFATVRRLTAHSNVTLAELLAHLGEIEARGLHRERACASLHTYCVYELRMSEDAAYRRAKAARLVRDYPEVRDAVAKGQLHLTGLLLIGPYLGTERHEEVILRARHRSKREILRLIAEIDPRPEVPARIEPLGPAPLRRPTHERFIESLSGPVRELRPGDRPADWIEQGGPEFECDADADADADVGSAPGAKLSPAPASIDAAAPGSSRQPLRYKVQFTADQAYVDLVQEALDLLGRAPRRPDLPELHRRALRLLVEQLKRQKRAARKVRGAPQPAPARNHPKREHESAPERTPAPARSNASGKSEAERTPAPAQQNARSKSEAERTPAPAQQNARSNVATAQAPRLAPERSPTPTTKPRHRRAVPAAVRRAVSTRDGERCAYVDERGQRCRETGGLEFHHRAPYACGGPSTVDNLELRCRAHNALAAEQDFGRELMERVRPAPPPG